MRQRLAAVSGELIPPHFKTDALIRSPIESLAPDLRSCVRTPSASPGRATLTHARARLTAALYAVFECYRRP